MGRREEARSEYEQAIAIQEKLAADFPAAPDYLFRIGKIQINLGLLLEDLAETGRGGGAVPGSASHSGLSGRVPFVPEYRFELARATPTWEAC